jgi:hypothetical protein
MYGDIRLFQMDYGLWNLHGGFWASSNPCGGDSVSRSLYTTVSTGSSGPFHGCAGEESALILLVSISETDPPILHLECVELYLNLYSMPLWLWRDIGKLKN